MKQLKAKRWRLFTFSSGHFALHVPTGHILELPDIKEKTIKSLKAFEKKFGPEMPRKLGKIVIKTIALNVVQTCNLNCSYCYAGQGDYGHASSMTEEVAYAAVKQFAKKTDELKIVFFGGEPLLKFDLIKKVVHYCSKLKKEGISCKFSFGLTTNGTLLDDETISFLAKHHFHLKVSYDGDGVQDRQRCFKADSSRGIIRGTERVLEEAIYKLHEKKKDFSSIYLRGTLLKESIPALESVITSTLFSKLIPFTLVPETTNDKGLIFTEADIAKVEQIYRKICFDLIADKDYDVLSLFAPIMSKMDCLHHGKISRPYCGAGLNYISVSASGRYFLCHRFTENISGDVGSIEENLDEKKIKKILKLRLLKDLKKGVFCQTCWMRESCAGACYHQNFILQGDLLIPDPLTCLWQDMEFRVAMEVYTHLLPDWKNFKKHLSFGEDRSA